MAAQRRGQVSGGGGGLPTTGAVRPALLYDPLTAFERGWPPVVGFPLTVAWDREDGDLYLHMMVVEPTQALAGAAEVAVWTADIVGVPWTNDFLTDPRKPAFVFSRVWGNRRAMMNLRVVNVGGRETLEALELGETILAGGDGVSGRRLSFKVGPAEHRLGGPWYDKAGRERQRWFELDELVSCVGSSEALHALLEAR